MTDQHTDEMPQHDIDMPLAQQVYVLLLQRTHYQDALREARDDFNYIIKSINIAMGNASTRGDDTIDSAVVAAGLKAEKSFVTIDKLLPPNSQPKE